MRLIDADALMEIYMDRLSLVADRYSLDSSECGILTGAVKLLDAQPTIEPERNTGKWMREDGEHVEPDAICSACGFDWMWSDRGYFKFCPNCGARMDGSE